MFGMHPNICDLLLRRFLWATCKCYQLEFQLLALFLLYTEFDVTDPRSFLKFCSAFYVCAASGQTWCHLLVLLLHASSYGMLLCLMHQRLPVCHILWQPLKLCLLAVQLSLSCYSHWLYLGYSQQTYLNMDMSHYLWVSSVCCAISHFVAEFGRPNCVVWPQPMLQLDQSALLAYRLKLPSLWRALQRSVLPVLIAAAYYAPDLPLLSLSCCLCTLITAQLLQIKAIYGQTMMRKLPLTLRSELRYRDWELELSLILAIGVTAMPGFELQVARSFYEDMSNARNDECCQLFQLRNKNKWQLVRNTVLDRITDFMQQLDRCRGKGNNTAHITAEPRPSHANMRPLMLNQPVPGINCSRRLYGKRPPCQPFLPTKKSRWLQWVFKQQRLLSKQLRRMLRRRSAQHLMELELSRGTAFTWLVPALACICVRSLKEDTYGILHADMCRIFKVLLELESLLLPLHNSEKYSSVCLVPLLKTTSRAVNKLKYHFMPYLEFIIADDDKLLKQLQSRK